MTARITLLFLHIPKCGGSSLASCIDGSHARALAVRGESDLPAGHPGVRFLHQGAYYYPIGFFKDPPGKPLPGHVLDVLSRTDLRAVIGHFSFGIHRIVPTCSTYVTLLRDPVDRVLSLYFHLRAEGVLRAEVTLEEFASGCPPDGWNAHLTHWHPERRGASEKAIRAASRALADNDQTRRIAGVEPAFGECTEMTLASAQENLRRHFRVVGTTERFDETLLLMSRALGWEGTTRYLPKLVNAANPGRAAVPAYVLEQIRRRNRFDHALHRFASALLDESVSRQGIEFRDALEEFRQRQADHVRRFHTAIASMSLGNGRDAHARAHGRNGS